MHLARLTALALVAATLLACKPAFDIRLASGDERAPDPAFVISARDDPRGRPRYHTVKLYDEASEALLWHLRAAPFGDDASQASLRYAVTPEGFEAVVEAAPLVPGGAYVLVVSGTARGQLRFDVGSDGRVQSRQ